MESFNFGAFDTQLPGRIAAIPQEAQKQQTANMLQAMQVQGAMRQNEMSQMQLDELKSDRAEMVKLQQELEAKGGSPDLGRLANVLMKSPKHFKLGIELSQKIDAQARFDKLNSGDALPPAPTEAPANMLPGVVSAPAGITNPPAAPQAQPTIANLNRQIAANMALGTEQGYKYAEMLQKRVDALSKRYTVGTTLMGAEGNIIGTAPEATSQEIRTMQALGYPPTQAGYAAFRATQRQPRLLTPDEEDQRTRIALASRPPAQPRPEQPPVAVIDNTGKTVYVSREEAIRRRMPPANTAEKPMTEAQRVTYAKDKVSDRDIVTGALAVTGELEKLTDELVGNPDKKIAPAPGLNSITGYSALTNPLALPSGDARKALQKLETFRGKIMALGRQLASQEGKLGNMAVQEWKFVSDAVQKIDPAAGNLDEQMRDVVRQSREYARRQQAKYDDTYADDLTAPPQAAPAAAISVTAPNGKTYPFATPAQAAAFKKAAGIP